MTDLTWLLPLRWPLTAILLAVGVYFWRRRPEREQPWQPPAAQGQTPPLEKRPPDAERE